MKRILLFLAGAGILTVIISCNPQAPQIPTQVNVNQNQVVGGGSGSGTVDVNCPPVDRVRIVNYPSALAVGASAGIDVTPKDANGQNRSDNCNEKDGNRWDSNDSVCTVPNPSAFNTNIRGVSAGTCELTACVAGKCDTVKFPVQ